MTIFTTLTVKRALHALILLILIPAVIATGYANAAGAPTPGISVQPKSYPPAPTPAAEDSPLYLRIYKGSQRVVALRLQHGTEVPVRVMICSTGRTPGLTPNGKYRISSKYVYHSLEGAKGQYCSRIRGGIMFHSVPIANSARTAAAGRSRMNVSYYNMLGSMASHGCVRLLVQDAKWIFDNCPSGTLVETVGGKSPYGGGVKPALKRGKPYMSADGKYGWDPTDPDAANPYRKTPAPAATPKPSATRTPMPSASAPPAPG